MNNVLYELKVESNARMRSLRDDDYIPHAARWPRHQQRHTQRGADGQPGACISTCLDNYRTKRKKKRASALDGHRRGVRAAADWPPRARDSVHCVRWPAEEERAAAAAGRGRTRACSDGQRDGKEPHTHARSLGGGGGGTAGGDPEAGSNTDRSGGGEARQFGDENCEAVCVFLLLLRAGKTRPSGAICLSVSLDK